MTLFATVAAVMMCITSKLYKLRLRTHTSIAIISINIFDNGVVLVVHVGICTTWIILSDIRIERHNSILCQTSTLKITTLRGGISVAVF